MGSEYTKVEKCFLFFIGLFFYFNYKELPLRDEPIAGGRAIGFFVLAHAVECRTEFRVTRNVSAIVKRVG